MRSIRVIRETHTPGSHNCAESGSSFQRIRKVPHKNTPQDIFGQRVHLIRSRRSGGARNHRVYRVE